MKEGQGGGGKVRGHFFRTIRLVTGRYAALRYTAGYI